MQVDNRRKRIRSRHPLLVISPAAAVLAILVNASAVQSQQAWYTEGDFAPQTRIPITLINTLNVDRQNCPIVLERRRLPLQDLHEMWVTVVDPRAPSIPEPTPEQLFDGGGHLIRGETNGHQIFRQLDDIDKDGLWDELFFMTNLKALESKPMFLYIGFSQRGWNPHGTQAALGSYCRHLMPFWESGDVGWKLWYPTDCDVYGKRKKTLMSHELYQKNLNGYAVPYEYGSDIMTVATSFGGGGICLFEYPTHPDSVSRPRFAPVTGKRVSDKGWNEGPVSDSRYSYDVIANGPLRSSVRVRTMNWKTDRGSFELEQVYTALKDHNYSTCQVKFLQYKPGPGRSLFGCGIRKNGREFDRYQKGGVVMTAGDEEIADPDDKSGSKKLRVAFVGTALVVKDRYRPEFRNVPGYEGNYAFALEVTPNLEYEYAVFAAWSEGSVLNTASNFKNYVIGIAQELNHPVVVSVDSAHPVEIRKP